MASTTPPTVTIDGCTITGKAQPASAQYPRPVDLFYGVPYASARRFGAPVLLPLGASSLPVGTLDASRPGPGCPAAMAQHKTAESPLRLNIFRPAGRTASSPLLPVVVYFHGGAFNFGNALDSGLDSFVSHPGPAGAGDVLAVTVSYRLGALGFLNAEGGELNLGLKDQRVAVEWVAQFVKEFGGDGGDVTLMGVSAGAHSIGHHILNPKRLPIRKAILESGSPTARSVLQATHPRTAANITSLKSNLRPSNPALLPTLKVDDVLNAGVMVWAEHMNSLTWPFQPVVDGEGGAVPDLPLKLWEGYGGEGGLRSVLTGFCSHEGSDFIPKRPPPFRQFFTKLIPSLTPADLDALESLYPASGTTTDAQIKRLYEAYGHYAYICPVIHTAHAISRNGGRVYLYEFAALTNPDTKTAAHASHTEALTRSLLFPARKPGLQAAGEAMHDRWTTFISSPEGVIPQESWPAFETPFVGGDDGSSGKGQLLVFGEGNDETCGGKNKGVAVQTRTLTEREKDVCRFWWDRMELSQGMGKRGVVSKAW